MDKRGLAMFWSAALVGCAATQPLGLKGEGNVKASPDRIAAHVRELASDEFAGRVPGTLGEKKTINYIIRQFRRAGLSPGNRGSWLQAVPLVRAEPDEVATLTVRKASGVSISFRQYKDMVLVSGRRQQHEVLDNSEVVFVGYGINAPEIEHDDYAGIDVKHKTLLMLAWAPDAAKFQGNARFRYGNPLRKSEEAARRGAAAVLIITPDGDAWENSIAAVRGRALSAAGAKIPPRAPIDGRIKRSAVLNILTGSAITIEQLENQAIQRNFRPVPLGLTVSGRLESHVRRFNSFNVIGYLQGTERPQEHVVFVGHWDAYPECASLFDNDRICNGALDNASGIGQMIEMARLFGRRSRTKRSVLFLATTAEEQGFIGSEFYTQAPVMPLDQAVGGANLDMTAGRGSGTNLVLFGRGLSEIDIFFERAAARQGRRVVSPREEDADYFQRSDNMSFVTRGVPVLTATGLWSEGAGREDLDSYFDRHYHRPSDAFSLIRSFDGTAEDAEFLYYFGQALAQSEERPGWKVSSPYKARGEPKTQLRGE